MTQYQQTSLSTSLSQFVEMVETQHEAVRSFERGSDTQEPTVKVGGMLWNRTNFPDIGDAYLRWNGSAWTLFADATAAQLNAEGTVPLAADWDVGNHKIMGLEPPTQSGDAARYDEVFADGNAYFIFNEDCAVTQASNIAGTYEPVGFTPRQVVLRLFGEVRRQSDNSLIGSIDQEITFRRYEGNAGAGFAGTSGNTLVKNVTVGSTSIDLYVEPKYTSPLGFWFRCAVNGSGDLCNVAMVQQMSWFGFNQ